jgi:hypothetical protein
MQKSERCRPSEAAAAAFAVLLFPLSAGAAEISFAGKKVDMYIGSTAGGGTDISSRLLGDYIVKYLPGQPTIIYRNIPGGQGVKALNYFASSKVKPDGLSLAGGSQGHIDLDSRSLSAVEYDPLKFEYIGGFSRGGTLFVMRKSAIPRLSDKTAKPVVVPAVEVVASGPQMALWGMEFLGWNAKIVLGYGGTPAMILAARQGEADSMSSSSTLALKPLLEDPDFVPFMQFGDLDDSGKFVARPAYANVPVFASEVEKKMAPSQQRVFESWLQAQYLDKWFALPPGTPKEYIAVYNEAFRKATQDPNFIKQANVMFGEDFKSISAELITRLVSGMVRDHEAVNKFVTELRRKNGLPVE